MRQAPQMAPLQGMTQQHFWLGELLLALPSGPIQWKARICQERGAEPQLVDDKQGVLHRPQGLVGGLALLGSFRGPSGVMLSPLDC